jgi:small subunit ribosomal protein S8
MTMTDPVADMLTRIRNALLAGHRTTDVPASRLKLAVARILKEEGFILDVQRVEDNRQGMLRLQLKYGPGGETVISGLERISRPGRRVYCPAEDIPEVLGGLGITVLSTSRGVLSGREARQQRVGGELLLNVW